MYKIDLHLHLMPYQTVFGRGTKLSGPQEMLMHLDRLGIRKAVLMSGCQTLFPAATNEAVRDICREYPHRYAWMCNLDPCQPEEVYDRLAGYQAMGAVGIGELALNRRLDDPFLQVVFAAAQELGLPVTIHMSPEVGCGYGVVDDPGLPLLEEILRTYPNLKILGHSKTFWLEISGDAPTDRDGRRGCYTGPVIPGGRLPDLFSKYPNLYGDLSGASGGNAMMRDPQFGLSFLECYSDRLFFATDMLNTDMVFPLGAWMDEQMAQGKLSPEAYENVCRKNATQIFGI